MKKSDFHRSNRTLIQCIQAIDLYVKTTKRAMLTLSFSAEKIKESKFMGAEPIINMKFNSIQFNLSFTEQSKVRTKDAKSRRNETVPRE